MVVLSLQVPLNSLIGVFALRPGHTEEGGSSGGSNDAKVSSSSSSSNRIHPKTTRE